MNYNPDNMNTITSMEQINRASFPKARVFIYGREVSDDLLSVRINQSSGSLERSPSTATFTISNYLQKYTLTNSDMIKIGTLKHKINGTYSAALQAAAKGGTVDLAGINYSDVFIFFVLLIF